MPYEPIRKRPVTSITFDELPYGMIFFFIHDTERPGGAHNNIKVSEGDYIGGGNLSGGGFAGLCSLDKRERSSPVDCVRMMPEEEYQELTKDYR